MATTQKLMTAEELSRLPDDGQRHELLAGELRAMPPSGAEHGGIALPCGAALRQYVTTHQFGRVFGAETGFLLTTNPDMMRAPDAAFVSRERARAAGRVTGYWPGAPDLAGEVSSPNDLYTDVDEQVATRLAHGTRLVLVVDPRRRAVALHRPGAPIRQWTAGDTLDGEEGVPGWTMPVREIFATGS